MKANANDKVKSRELKSETSGKLWKLTKDPTLEGSNENKVGRIERKSDRTTEKALKK